MFASQVKQVKNPLLTGLMGRVNQLLPHKTVTSSLSRAVQVAFFHPTSKLGPRDLSMTITARGFLNNDPHAVIARNNLQKILNPNDISSLHIGVDMLIKINNLTIESKNPSKSKADKLIIDAEITKVKNEYILYVSTMPKDSELTHALDAFYVFIEEKLSNILQTINLTQNQRKREAQVKYNTVQNVYENVQTKLIEYVDAVNSMPEHISLISKIGKFFILYPRYLKNNTEARIRKALPGKDLKLIIPYSTVNSKGSKFELEHILEVVIQIIREIYAICAANLTLIQCKTFKAELDRVRKKCISLYTNLPENINNSKTQFTNMRRYKNSELSDTPLHLHMKNKFPGQELCMVRYGALFKEWLLFEYKTPQDFINAGFVTHGITDLNILAEKIAAEFESGFVTANIVFIENIYELYNNTTDNALKEAYKRMLCWYAYDIHPCLNSPNINPIYIANNYQNRLLVITTATLTEAPFQLGGVHTNKKKINNSNKSNKINVYDSICQMFIKDNIIYKLCEIYVLNEDIKQDNIESKNDNSPDNSSGIIDFIKEISESKIDTPQELNKVFDLVIFQNTQSYSDEIAHKIKEKITEQEWENINREHPLMPPGQKGAKVRNAVNKRIQTFMETEAKNNTPFNASKILNLYNSVNKAAKEAANNVPSTVQNIVIKQLANKEAANKAAANKAAKEANNASKKARLIPLTVKNYYNALKANQEAKNAINKAAANKAAANKAAKEANNAAKKLSLGGFRKKTRKHKTRKSRKTRKS